MIVLIIGFGSIGKRHYEILSQFKQISQIHILTKQQLKDKSAFKNLKKINLNIYDYIIIASETSKHYKQLKYIEKNTTNKKILVEKPLFHKFKKLNIKNNQIFIGYNRRFYEILQKIKQEIKNQKCLFVQIYAGQYLPFWRPDRDYKKTYSAIKKLGGGVLLDLSHEIDYINYLFGNIKKIYAINDKISNLQINTDDICTAILKTNKNTIVNFTIDYISKDFMHFMIIHQENQTIKANLLTMELKITAKNDSKEYKFDNLRNNSFQAMHKNILFQDDKICCSYKEALNIMKIIKKIRKQNEKF